MAENEPVDYDEVIPLSEITGGGTVVDKGRYRAKLTSVTGKLSKSTERPMVEANFDIEEGKFEGVALPLWFSLSITEFVPDKGPNRGKKQYRGRGIADMKAACAAVGRPLSEGFKKHPTQEDAQRAAVLFGAAFHPKYGSVEIAVIEEERKKKNPETGKWETEKDSEGKPVIGTRSKIIGPWKKQGDTSILNSVLAPAAGGSGLA